jgi:2-isopropylmalate synthase
MCRWISAGGCRRSPTRRRRIWDAFAAAYHLDGSGAFALAGFEERRGGRSTGDRVFVGRIRNGSREVSVSGRGNGLLSGAVAALNDAFGLGLDVVDFQEHALRRGADAQAVAYLECRTVDGRTVFGVGIDEDIATASVKAAISAANAV